jgi:hypothetical protein
MLKGYIFKEQTFNNEVCALIFNEYLNNTDGIFGNYKNAMAVSKNGSNVTIANGIGIIKGRAVGEDSSTTLDAGTTEMYCKLVIEIDLDKVNTASSFLQASYKIIKSASNYPNLTQDNIIRTNSGVYQYELARFRTTANGIIDFEDRRTFLDIPTIYEQVVDMVQGAIDSIEDRSAFVLKSQMSYSTDEIDTGKVWINGKPIYRKTFTGNALNNQLAEINIENLNVDTIFFVLDKSYSQWKPKNNSEGFRWAPIIQTCVSKQGLEPEPAYYQSEVFANDLKTRVIISFGKNMVVMDWVLTIEYTKTID